MFTFSNIGTGQNPQNFEMTSQIDTPKNYLTATDMALIQLLFLLTYYVKSIYKKHYVIF